MVANRRPGSDAYFLALAALVATRSTCYRRAVGCVLVDARGHVLATGYNGVAPKHPHCNEAVLRRAEVGRDTQGRPILSDSYDHPHACAGANAPSGVALDSCAAIHAEANALVQCADPYAIATVYVTAEPCVSCTKLLLVSGCRRVVALEPYPNSGKALWLASAAARGGDRVWHVPGRLDRESGGSALEDAQAAMAEAKGVHVQVIDLAENKS